MFLCSSNIAVEDNSVTLHDRFWDLEIRVEMSNDGSMFDVHSEGVGWKGRSLYSSNSP